MTDRIIIEAVRKFPCLYNNPSRRNVSMSRHIWKEMGRELRLPAVECRERWNRLRSAYVHAITRRKQGIKKYRKWKLEDEMSFLAPYLKFKKNDNSQFRQHEMPDRQELNNDWEEQQNRAVTEKNKQTNTKHSKEMPSSSSQTNQDNRKASKEKKNDLDLFFHYLSGTIKKLPRIEQIQLKTDIINLVSQAEMRALQPQSSGSQDTGEMKTEAVSSTRHQIKIEIDPKSSEAGSGGESTDFDDPLT